MTVRVPNIDKIQSTTFQAQILDIDNLHLTLHTEFPFDQSSPNWYPNHESNAFFVRQIEAISNDRLKAQGQMFLNEVLDALGIRRVQSGQIMGWGSNRDITDVIDIQIGFDENQNMVLSLNPHRIILDLLEN